MNELSERPETDIHSFFTFDSEPSYKIVRTEEPRGDVARVIKQVSINIENGPYRVIEDVTRTIEEAIAEGRVPATERERLINEARSGYFMVFPPKLS